MTQSTDKLPEDVLSRKKRLKRFVEQEIRPRIQFDGGDIHFVEYDGERLTVSMEEECSKCPAVGHIKTWLEKQIASSLGFECTVVQKIKKPYYWV